MWWMISVAGIFIDIVLVAVLDVALRRARK